MTTGVKEDEIGALRSAFRIGTAVAAKLGVTPLASGIRVRAHFPFCNHVSEGTIVGCDEGSALAMSDTTFGYLVRLDVPLPGGWRPNGMPFCPYQNVEPL